MENNLTGETTIGDSISLELLTSNVKLPPLPANGEKLLEMTRHPVKINRQYTSVARPYGGYKKELIFDRITNTLSMFVERRCNAVQIRLMAVIKN